MLHSYAFSNFQSFRERVEVEHRRRRTFLRGDQVQLAVGHPRGERSQAAISRNQLHFHRSRRIRRIADDDRLGDAAIFEIPDPDAATHLVGDETNTVGQPRLDALEVVGARADLGATGIRDLVDGLALAQL